MRYNSIKKFSRKLIETNFTAFQVAVVVPNDRCLLLFENPINMVDTADLKKRYDELLKGTDATWICYGFNDKDVKCTFKKDGSTEVSFLFLGRVFSLFFQEELKAFLEGTTDYIFGVIKVYAKDQQNAVSSDRVKVT